MELQHGALHLSVWSINGVLPWTQAWGRIYSCTCWPGLHPSGPKLEMWVYPPVAGWVGRYAAWVAWVAWVLVSRTSVSETGPRVMEYHLSDGGVIWVWASRSRLWCRLYFWIATTKRKRATEKDYLLGEMVLEMIIQRDNELSVRDFGFLFKTH